MSRLEAVAQALYYPTPLRVVAGLAKLIQITNQAENGNGGKQLRILDPCAGKGLAVSLLAELLASQSNQMAEAEPDCQSEASWRVLKPAQTHLSSSLAKLNKNKKGSFSNRTRLLGSNLIETYGIELDRYRAQAASTRMSQVLNTDAKTAKVSTNSFDLAFHNPPYDAAPGSEKRLEHQFLKRVTWLLKPGGLLVHIIPQSSLRVSAEFLANHYQQIEVLRFPYPEYSRFGQVVVLALKKRVVVEDKVLEKQLKQLAGVAGSELKPVPACPTSREELRALLEEAGILNPDQLDMPEEESEISQELAGTGQAQFRQHLEELELVGSEAAETLTYQLQPQRAVAGAKLIFAVGEYHLAEALVEASRSGVWSNRLAREQLTGTYTTTSSKTIHRPLMPLRDGQAALLTSLGLLNNLVLTAEATADTPAQAIVVKGQALKEFKTRKVETDENGEETSRTDRQILRTELRTLDLASGELSLIQPAQMSQFIERYKPSIQRQMLENYPPRYIPRPRQTDPLIQQLEAGVARLGRKPLGGQRLALVGAALSLREQRGTVISAEQGSGKSYLGSGAAYLAGMRRVVVICPTHLTKKWVREISQTIPGAQGVVVKKISDLMQACALIARHEHSLTQRLTNETGARDGTGSGVRVEAQPGYGTKALPPFFVVISKESMKLDSRWEPAVMWRVPRPVPLDGKGRPILTKQAHCPRCGQLVTASYDDEQPIDWLTLQTKKRYCRALVRNGKGQRRECREPLWHKTAKRVGVSPFLSKEERARQTSSNSNNAKAGPRRLRLARYIKEKLNGYFDLLILDEVQDMRGKGTGQGIAAGVLASACKKVLALSGTFSGGYSTSLFHLLYRFTDEIRHEYQLGDDLGWAWDYGIIERTTFRSSSNGQSGGKAGGETEDEEEVLEDGAMSDRKTVRVRFKEAPGISPAVLLKMIGYTIFLKITDVARDLPLYQEHVLELPMQGESDEEAKAAGYSQHRSYQKLADDLYAEVRQQLLRGSSRLLGALVQSLLSWPDNPTLEETVIDKRDNKVVASAPALPEEILYPKEQALLDLYRRENTANRKLLVFISNTKKRDLAPRLKTVLEREAGAKVAVLRSDKVEASEREAWVERQLQEGIDVLICHPRLVQTGLDLLAFQTIVFYQIEYSVYVQRQASRRSWRIGQTQPIHVYHFVYRASSQAGALRHQAKKMQASNLLEGDLSAEGLVGLADEDNEDNLMLEMARAIVREKEKEKAHLAVSQSGKGQPQPEREREEEDATSALSLEDLLASLHQSEVGAAKLILEAGLNEELELEEAVTELYEALVAPTQPQTLPELQTEGPTQAEPTEIPVVAISAGLVEPSGSKPKVSMEQLRDLMLQERARKHSRRNKNEAQTAEKPEVTTVQQLSLF